VGITEVGVDDVLVYVCKTWQAKINRRKKQQYTNNSSSSKKNVCDTITLESDVVPDVTKAKSSFATSTPASPGIRPPDMVLNNSVLNQSISESTGAIPATRSQRKKSYTLR